MFLLPSRTVITESEEETGRLGALLAKHTSVGMTILLTGGLGSGKTTLVRGFCEALGFRKVRSPSFTLVNHYIAEGRRIVHSDLYRLESRDVDDLDLEEDDSDDTVLFVEWAEKASFFPKGLYGKSTFPPLTCSFFLNGVNVTFPPSTAREK